MSTEAITDAITGGAPVSQSLTQQIGTMATKLDVIATDMVKAKDEDTARYQALKEEHQATATTLTELKAKHDAEKRDADLDDVKTVTEQWKAALANIREPSKAAIISQMPKDARAEGDFLMGVFMANGRDTDVQAEGKAMLASLGMKARIFASNPNQKALFVSGDGKATVGLTDATGGWVIPNAIVEEVIKPAAVRNIYHELMTVVPGVTSASVDVPFRSGARSAAAVATFGATKENTDIAYNGYTATMYTLARIYDIGNQFLRQSRGAAETDVMQELAAAFAQGEANYIREGTGTNQPFGYTSALNNAQPAFRSSFTPSATTLAGSIAKAIATATGALAGRGVQPTAAVLSAASYWNMLSQGSDSAGFFFAPLNGPTAIKPNTLLSPFGIPVFPDSAADLLGTGAVTDNLVVADWKAFKVYFGENYRVDSSDQAGTRWDTNMTGFRGEEEMGFDARPAVYAGYAQMIQDIEA